MTIAMPSGLSDTQLVTQLLRCARDERHSTAQLVAHLAEFDTRRLHLAAGYSSLFAYCRSVLGLSEHATYNRIEAARAAKRFPVILARLADATLSLTSVRLLAPHLTDENHAELLAAASRRSKQELEELLARLHPRPDTPSSVRKVPDRPSVAPAPIAAPSHAPSSLESTEVSPAGPPVEPLVAPPEPASLPRGPLVTPLAPARYEIRFTASAATRDKLKVAQDLLRHSVPSGDPAEIIDRALTALIDELSRTKLAIVRKPLRTPRRTARGSRHIPSEVKRAVWARDGGRCAFVAADGHHCSERGFLEYHHVKPFAVGGEATVGNIQLRCRAHNGYESEVFYGAIPEDGGAGRVNEGRPEYAVSRGFRLVPERVGTGGGARASGE